MKRLPVVAALVFSFLIVHSPSSAQTSRAARPYQGLFGGSVDESGQVLTLQGSVGGGYDDDVVASVSGGGVIPSGTRGGTLRQVTAGLNYSLNRERLTTGISTASSVRDYPDSPLPVIHMHRVSGIMSWQARENTSIASNVSVSYQPLSIASLFPSLGDAGAGQMTVPDVDLALAHDHYMAYSGGIAVDQRVGQRSFWSGEYAYRQRDETVQLPRFIGQRGSTAFRFLVGRDAGMRFGYTYENGDYGVVDQRRIAHHQVDAGFDVAWVHSASRRTALSLDAGASAADYPSSWRRVVNVNGRLSHEFGRSWNTSVSYRRGLQFVEVLPEPLFADSATIQLGGLISRRVQFQSSANASIGDADFSNRGFDTYRGAVGISVAVTRYVAAGLDYSYYHYRFRTGALLPPNVLGSNDRQSVRGYVSLWALLFQRR